MPRIMTRDLALALLSVALAALGLPAFASANFAIHGNYVADAETCEHCHRAHTSVSTITWASGFEQRSALLSSPARQMSEFCYTCHDATGQGADTNVEEGVYEGTLYGAQGAALNGGGSEFMPVFDESLNATVSVPVTSEHEVDCATCHDPHGSPNYRILKTQVNGNQVGEYVNNPTNPEDPDPDGWVTSVEEGWPIGGFRLNTAYPDYTPDYTTPRHAKGYDMLTGDENADKGMSGWCAGCHEVYLGDTTMQAKADRSAAGSASEGAEAPGGAARHRHPINVPLSNYNGPDKGSVRAEDSPLPLAHDPDASGNGIDGGNESSDWIECLTCHRAHGTVATMTDGTTSALLREDNRGVCQSYHNK